MGTSAQAETQLSPHIEVSPSSSTSISAIAANAPPPMPPPPYFKTYSINRSSFKAAINDKLNDPLISLFRLVVPILQIIFALVAGISYVIELSHGNGRGGASASFVFSQVVFGSTLVALIVNTISVRYYRISWVVDWILSIFWFALFATFYQVYLGGEMETAFAGVNLERMVAGECVVLVSNVLFGYQGFCQGETQEQATEKGQEEINARDR
jgi:hypothetical protein